MLPDLKFKQLTVKDNEIFFETSGEIQRVVSQGIAANIVLKLPGLGTNVILCFPIPSLVRVYLNELKIARGWLLGENYYYVGQFGRGHQFYRLPEEVEYQYGMELTPWMYDWQTKTDIRGVRSRIVNYIIMNCNCGHDGVLLKLKDETDSEERYKEWLKIIWFDAGNNYHFWNGEGRTEICELSPVYHENTLFWAPQNWEQLKKIERLPGKVQ